MRTYKLNVRGVETVGGTIGDEVTAAEVQEMFVEAMGGDERDIEVRSTGLWLIDDDNCGNERRILIAEAVPV